MQDLHQLKDQFIKLYAGEAEEIRYFFAPGRVNLIGEHTDYNGGYVFPAALTFGTTLLLRKRSDDKLCFASTNFDLSGTITLQGASYNKEDDWINYPKAILFHLQKRGFSFSGYDILYHGEIPNGAGLSSSASLQLVTAYGFMCTEGHEIDRVKLALIAQESENQFMGVNCGIMDQFTVAMGKRDHAVMLKCDTLDYEYVPFESKGYKLVIANTNKRRGLVDSEYNARRAQCGQAVKALSGAFPELKMLCELDSYQFSANESLITDQIVKNRAKHVIEENERVKQSVRALTQNELGRFGNLMIASHQSLKNLYEVSCSELDILVEEALEVEGVIGSRMTGAGFGGCTVSVVSEDQVEEFMQQVGLRYEKRSGLRAEFYVAKIGDGVTELA